MESGMRMVREWAREGVAANHLNEYTIFTVCMFSDRIT